MNLDIDDPLGSDDSFFDEPRALGKKTSTKTNTKKTIENIFGPVEKELKTPQESSTDIVDSVMKSKHAVTFEDSVMKTDGAVGLAPKRKDDWLIDSESSKVLDSQSGKRSDFFEDILSARPKSSVPAKKLSSLDDILKDSRAISKKTEKDIAMGKHSVPNLGFSNINQERRRPRKGSATGIEDTLGLFEEEISKKGEISKSAEDIKSNTKYDKGKNFK